MSTSSGGGYCDCGDKEAWKQNESCTYHKAVSSNEDPGPSLSAFDSQRAHLLYQFILEYAIEMLTYEHAIDLPTKYYLSEDDIAKLQMKSTSKVYGCILYNDESHTFEVVIQTLTRALETGKRQAIEFATAIDREGRAIVKIGTFKASLNTFD